jgi:WD40 repeat protein
MTQAAMESNVVRKEWRQARQEGVGVIPVFGQPNLDLSQLPRWMRDVHWVNTEVPEQWTRFIRTLESPHQGTKMPFMADDLPVDYVTRPKEFEELAGNLLDPQQEEPIAITAALKGAGGYGKTTLAKALCHDERIQDAFHDGILWVTLGEEPNVMTGLTKLYAALTEKRPNFADQEDASNRLAEVLEGKDCLMVIDDVWNAAHATPFLRGGKRCARIITTRNSGVLPPSAKLRVDVDAMQQREAVALLAFELPEGESEALGALAKKLGEWPFLLKLVNGTLRDRVNAMGQALLDAITYVNKALQKRGLTAFDDRNPVERNQAVTATLGASFEHLTVDELARYQELAIFPEDVEVPLSTISKLWGATGGFDDFDTEELCARLQQLSLLLSYDLATQHIRLHDVVRTFLMGQIEPHLKDIHQKFLNVYGLEQNVGRAAHDIYLCRNLAYHLLAAERVELLCKTLLTFDWLQTKLVVTDVPTLLSDFAFITGDVEVAFVKEAIQLSSPIISSDKAQFPGQMLGRLLAIESPGINSLLNSIKGLDESPGLRPLNSCLKPPGSSLLWTLPVHIVSDKALKMLPDGKSVACGTKSGGVKILDLTCGQVPKTMNRSEIATISTEWAEGHWDSDIFEVPVTAMALTPDGQQVICGYEDGLIKLWDIKEDKDVQDFSASDSFEILRYEFFNVAPIIDLAVTKNSLWIISLNRGGSLRVWDLSEGKEVFLDSGHGLYYGSLGYVLPLNNTQVIISRGGGIEMLHLSNGKFALERMLNSFDSMSDLTCLAVIPEGDGIVRGFDNGEIEGEFLGNRFLFLGHRDWIQALAVTHNGKRVVSGSGDGVVKIWDLTQEKEVWSLVGHEGGIYDLAITPDDVHLISACGDGSLKIWDITKGTEVQNFRGHVGMLRAVVAAKDGKIVSASDDGTVKVWNISNKQGTVSNVGHTDSVEDVAFALTGPWIVSASMDGTLKVWNQYDGKEVHSLSGHKGPVKKVVITPDGNRAISASFDKNLKVWDLKNGQEICTLVGHSGAVFGLTVINNGKNVISASRDRTLKLWDLEDERLIHSFEGHQKSVWQVMKTFDDRQIISTSDDKTLKVWDIRKKKEVNTTLAAKWEFIFASTITPDGRFAIWANENGILRVWEWSQGRLVAELIEHIGPVFALGATPDGCRVISGGSDNKIVVWDLLKLQKIHVLNGHSGSVMAMVVSEDGKWLVSASRDQTVRVWDLEIGVLSETFYGDGALLSCAISSDGKTIVAGESSGRVYILRMEARID